MATVRIMNLNIEKLSYNKIQIPGMARAIAKTVKNQYIDILVIVEVANGNSNLMIRIKPAVLLMP